MHPQHGRFAWVRVFGSTCILKVANFIWAFTKTGGVRFLEFPLIRTRVFWGSPWEACLCQPIWPGPWLQPCFAFEACSARLLLFLHANPA